MYCCSVIVIVLLFMTHTTYSCSRYNHGNGTATTENENVAADSEFTSICVSNSKGIPTERERRKWRKINGRKHYK